MIEDEPLLDCFRSPGYCELCHKPCRIREPHHLRAKGANSWARLDIRINLMALGSSQAFQCDCHTRIHNGKVSKAKLLEIVAKREGTTPEAIKAEIDRLLWHKE